MRRALAPALLLAATACGGAAPAAFAPSPGGAGPAVAPRASATASPAAPRDLDVADPALRDELLAMLAADQAELGVGVPDGARLPYPQDTSRERRLGAVLDAHGWPTVDLVGAQAATGAWVVAQHADDDLALQQRAVALMRPAVAAGQADPVELAYLEDRVAVNTGQPQVHGTQVRCRGGVPSPATPLADTAGVDDRRAALGLAPLAAYYGELAPSCAQEALDGADVTPG